MTDLLVNIGMWKNILKHREFDAAVDHAAVTQILKAKTEPATPRIIHLLDRLSSYSFILYYVKGRDMILTDYLSRHRQPDKDPSELIPISFCPMILHMNMMTNDTLLIATRSTTTESGEAPHKVHGADKVLNPHVKPENQTKIPTSKKVPDHLPSSLKSPPRELSTKCPVPLHSLSHQSGSAHQHSKTTPIEIELESPPKPTFYTPQPSHRAPQSDHTPQLLIKQYNPAHPTRRMGRM